MKKKHIVQRKPIQAAGQFDNSVSALLQHIYLNRGITRQEELQKDLSGLPTPETFKDMDKAVALLRDVLSQKQKITVIGDFDADGATSTALAVHCLRAMGFNADFLVPNRFKYGYGLTPEIVDVAITQQQPDLIITVDNGISSWQGVTLARRKGVRVLITDHHLPGQELPDAHAIVNPNQPGCSFPGKNIAGVAVIFYVMSALRKKLREENYFARHAIAEPNMAEYLDLVALGTVADVVSLDRINRILVHQGLLRLRSGRARAAFTALADLAKRPLARLTSGDLGFAYAPRLNAAGRMDDMSTGIRCLLSNNVDDARRLALELDHLNRDRKSVEQAMQQEAMKALELIHLEGSALSPENDTLPWGLCVFNDKWHQGVVGLLAARLKERYHRPVIAFAPGDISGAESGLILKGSARSIDGLHIRDVLETVATQHPGLIEKFGGHAMAAGLSLPKKNLNAFMLAFDTQVRTQLKAEQLQAITQTDGELAAGDFAVSTAKLLRDSEPWGQHFPSPLFEGVFQVLYKRPVGAQHLRLVLQPVDYGFDSAQPAIPERSRRAAPQIDAIVFFIDHKLKEQIADGDRIRLTYRLDVNEYQGNETLQLIVDYLEPCPVN
jgi:single-stranded-DNA-specific exonuclease